MSDCVSAERLARILRESANDIADADHGVAAPRMREAATRLELLEKMILEGADLASLHEAINGLEVSYK